MSLTNRVFLGVVSGSFCILLAWNAAPGVAEATGSSVYRCLQVHIGMTRHDAEHIMGVPLFSAPNDLVFRDARCSINISDKDRVYALYANFQLSRSISLQATYAEVIRDLPFGFDHYEDVTMYEDARNGSLSARNRLQDYDQIDISVTSSGSLALVSVNVYNHFIQRKDNPGFYPD